jgi:hypothetical protein
MTMSRTSPLRAAVAAVAALALPGAGGAGVAGASVNPDDPALAVPAGKIEHVVRDFRTTGDYGRHTIQELWLGSDRSHWISRDATTGRIVRETTFDRGRSLTFDATENSLRTMTDVGTTPPWPTLAQEAAIWRDAFATGKTRQVGETTALGRRALVLQSVEGKWKTDEPSQVTTMIVDAETFTVYEVKNVLAKHDFEQDDTVKSYETLDRTPATEALFAMTPHDGAKVIAARAGHRKVTHKKPKKAPKRTKHGKRSTHHR